MYQLTSKRLLLVASSTGIIASLSCQSGIADWRSTSSSGSGDGGVGDAGNGNGQDVPEGGPGGAPADADVVTGWNDGGPEAPSDPACSSGGFNSGGECVEWQDCANGTYVAEAGTSLVDRQCEPCPNGTYSDSVNADECTGWSVCQLGEFVSRPGSAAQDRECEACEDDTTTSTTNADECIPIGPCPSGSVRVSAEDGSAAGCDECSPGFYCAGGDAEIEACQQGEWDHDADPATPCEPHTACLAGTFLQEFGDGLRDQRCEACPEETFNQDVDSSTCQSWQTCAPGTYVDSAGSAETDVECVGCPSGSYSDSVNAEECIDSTVCQPGQYVTEPGTSTSDRSCADCPEGQYSSGINSGSCTDPDACEAGTIQIEAATDTSPAVCEPCSAGSFCAGGTVPAATCTAATWDDDANPATPCVAKTDCPPGQRVESAGDTTSDRTCAACGAGRFSTTTNSDSCALWEDCSPGNYVSFAGSTTMDRECSPCSNGTFTSSSNAASCAPWLTCTEPSFYQSSAPSSTEDRECMPCPAGQITTEDNATSCLVPVYQMAGGQVSMEAEHFYSKTDSATDAWTLQQISSASGGEAMEVGPDAPSGGHDWIDYMTTGSSPHFKFRVNFDRTGQFWVYVRGYAGAANPADGNSCWNSLDDEVFGIPHEFPATTGTWSWVGSGPLNVNSLGEHDIGIYAREDGFVVDKIVVKSSQSTPTGEGPAESPRE